MKILPVAYGAAEFAGLRRRTRVQAMHTAAGWARAGFLGDHEVRLAANGAGKARAAAAAAVDAAMASFRADAVASVGYCGAIDPGLAAADIVVGTSVLECGRCFAAQASATAAPHRRGAVCSIDRVAGTAAEKSALRSTEWFRAGRLAHVS